MTAITSRRAAATIGRIRRGPGTSARSRVGGQALVLFVVMIGVLSLGLILLFNTGQAVNKKVRLTHAADAAAYSVAVQQARVMNYAAYANRARVANEVAIAQMVSLWSWLNMIHAHAALGRNLFFALSKIPYIGIVFVPLDIAYSIAEPIIGNGVRGQPTRLVLDGAVKVLDELNNILALSTDAVVAVGGTVGSVEVANSVVQRNDPTARLAAQGHALLIMQLARTVPGGEYIERHNLPAGGGRSAGMDRFRNVVMASRDRFTADREDEMGIPFIDLETSGGTDMVDYKRWVGMDTMDLSVGIDLGFVDFTLDIPLGWGGAQAVKTQQGQAFFPGIRSGGQQQTGNGWYSEYHPGGNTYKQYGGVSQGSAGGNLAAQFPSVNAVYAPKPASGNLKQKRHAYLEGYDGLRAYQDIRADKVNPANPEEAGPVFTIYVESDRADARTAEDIDGLGGRNGGELELRSQMKDNAMTAIASAQTYFHRAPDYGLFHRLVPRSWNGDPTRDNQLEQGSLFSPYWQARLVDTPDSAYLFVGATELVGL